MDFAYRVIVKIYKSKVDPILDGHLLRTYDHWIIFFDFVVH